MEVLNSAREGLKILKHDFKGTMVEYFKAALSFPDAKPYPKVDYLEPTPMSQQIRLFMYDPVREFNQPYIKRYGIVILKKNLRCNELCLLLVLLL